jgi:hypothetical protein
MSANGTGVTSKQCLLILAPHPTRTARGTGSPDQAMPWHMISGGSPPSRRDSIASTSMPPVVPGSRSTPTRQNHSEFSGKSLNPPASANWRAKPGRLPKRQSPQRAVLQRIDVDPCGELNYGKSPDWYSGCISPVRFHRWGCTYRRGGPRILPGGRDPADPSDNDEGDSLWRRYWPTTRRPARSWPPA